MNPLPDEQWRITYEQDLTRTDVQRLSDELGLRFLWLGKPQEYVIACRIVDDQTDGPILEVTRREDEGVDFVLSGPTTREPGLAKDLYEQTLRIVRSLQYTPVPPGTATDPVWTQDFRPPFTGDGEFHAVVALDVRVTDEDDSSLAPIWIHRPGEEPARGTVATETVLAVDDHGGVADSGTLAVGRMGFRLTTGWSYAGGAHLAASVEPLLL